MYNDLFFGQPMGANTISVALDELVTTIAGANNVANKAAFVADWGVRYAAGAKAGQPLTAITGTAGVGQYTVTAGAYTFGDPVGTQVIISYTYTPAAGSGTQLNIKNQLMGFAPTIQILLETVYNSNQFSVLLYSCVASKLSFTTKQEDFIVPEFDFEAFSNASGQVIDIYSSE
jgi:hypothetical protein